MEKLIYSYALIRSYQKDNNNYLDTFSPFVLFYLKKNEKNNILHIQNGIRELFELYIPEHVINSILNIVYEKKYIEKTSIKYYLTEKGFNAKYEQTYKIHPLAPNIMNYLKPLSQGSDMASINRWITNNYEIDISDVLENILKGLDLGGYILIEREQYALTDKGCAHLNTFESIEEVARRMEPFFKELNNYLNKNIPNLETELNLHDSKEILMSFIHRNIEPIVDFVVNFPDKDKLYKSCKLIHHDKEIVLCDFARYLFDTNEDFYNILKDLILGSAISVAINKNDLTVTHKRLDKYTVFLDTNILFSLLGYHFDDFRKPIKELHELMIKWNFNIKIFDFTLEEAIQVINNCIKDLDYYNQGMKINSICAYLRSSNLDKYKMQEIVNHIDGLVRSLGIQIEVTNVNLDHYKIDDSKRLQMKKYKKYQGITAQTHDLAAIEIISKMRKKFSYKFEDAQPIFLTADGNLAKYDFKEMGHESRNSIPEVFVDRLLTNILWLIEPSTNIAVESLIATCARNKYISLNIWQSFLSHAKELEKDNKLSYDDITSSIYSDNLYKILRNLEDDDVDKLDDGYIKNIIEESSKQEKATKKLLVEKDNAIQLTEKKLLAARKENADLQENYNTLKINTNNLLEDKKSLTEKIKKIEDQKSTLESSMIDLKEKQDKLGNELDKLKIDYSTITNNLANEQKKSKYLQLGLGILIVIFLIAIDQDLVGTIAGIITLYLFYVEKIAYYLK